jgi:NADH-quinone oxidoreductase subunit L
MHLHEAEFSLGIALSSTALALFGIWLAWVIYAARLVSSDVLRRAFGPIHTLVVNKYYMDHLYENVLVAGVLYRGVGLVLDQFDRYVVDGAVNGVAWLTRRGGATLRLVQSGQLQGYAVVALAGLLIIVGMILLINP